MNNDVVEAVIEIPFRSRNKYERDEKTGRLKLNRVLYSAMGYPTEYGIIENTLAGDGDPLDILVIATEPTYPGCIVPARVVGYLEMYDDELLASPENEETVYMIRLENDIKEFKENKRSITNLAVPASTNVVYDTVDGRDVARIICAYTIVDGGVGKNTRNAVELVFKHKDML